MLTIEENMVPASLSVAPPSNLIDRDVRIVGVSRETTCLCIAVVVILDHLGVGLTSVRSLLGLILVTRVEFVED